ncbi:uncharacterized [Tachysurus ichikawai]
MARPPRSSLSISVSLHVSTETVASQIMFTQEARSQPAFVVRTQCQGEELIPVAMEKGSVVVWLLISVLLRPLLDEMSRTSA